MVSLKSLSTRLRAFREDINIIQTIHTTAPDTTGRGNETMSEITHTNFDGCLIQIVTPQRLREILDADGCDYERPSDLGPDDEWDTGSDASEGE